MREDKKGQRPNGGDPQSCHEANTCVGLFLYTCKHLQALFFSKMELLRGYSAGRVQVPIYFLRRVGRAYVGLPDGENVK
ncbi:hypothetical protein K443DRAFT_116383 [Laccaria amethystina LaAM-08-1]|uniref:Uncharacterized protein n=1 Tax=Laccaria amethystina LaAM-08-1 TaxID=1095629 RepID=A0A0C9WH52_9AGAR|nr:hypothetical protein K443DRAFT_116383 [Laccaria amethystina LaAM-08-1]